jgi:hypothetical protein
MTHKGCQWYCKSDFKGEQRIVRIVVSVGVVDTAKSLQIILNCFFSWKPIA